MVKEKRRIPEELQRWIDARRLFHLSHAHIQMARELHMNPRKFGSLNNHKQEPWKAPLPIFIEILYYKRFGKERPDRVVTIEERAQELAAKTAARRERRLSQRLAASTPEGEVTNAPAGDTDPSEQA
jgi:hypothetical protein